MKTVVIQTEKKETSRVTCRKNVLGRALPEALAAYKETFIFTDETVLALYGKKVRDVLGDVPVYAMPAGEEHKTPETLLSLLAAMTGAVFGLRIRRTYATLLISLLALGLLMTL